MKHILHSAIFLNNILVVAFYEPRDWFWWTSLALLLALSATSLLLIYLLERERQ